MPSAPRPYSVWTKLIKLVLNSKETGELGGSLRITTTRERMGGICRGEIEKGTMEARTSPFSHVWPGVSKIQNKQCG